MMQKKVKFALLGFGNVGRPLLELLDAEKDRIAQRQHLEFICTGVSDSKGCAVDKNGLDMRAVFAARATSGSVGNTAHAGHMGMHGKEMLDAAGADLLVEALPPNIVNGEPGFSLLLHALDLGMDVVTSNKSHLALYWKEIFTHAKKNRLFIRYGASSNAALHTLELGKFLGSTGELLEFSGIFNSTCPYVLEQMQNGLDFSTAIKEAQDLGIAEKEYTVDTDGWDVAEKTVIQANTFWDTNFTLKDVDRSGIAEITRADLLKAQQEGKVWRFVGRARVGENSYLSAKPECVPVDSFLGKASWHDKAICLTTRSQGIQLCYSMGAAETATPGTVLMDMISVALLRI